MPTSCFFSLLGSIRPLSLPARVKAAVLGITALMLIGAAELTALFLVPSHASILRDWLPAPLMLFAYWQAGVFFRKPNRRLQNALESFDRRVLPPFVTDPRSRRAWNIEVIFELFYCMCYPLVPAGLVILYSMEMGNRIEEYWLVVIPACYMCYGALPFLQTLPPRTARSSGQAGLETALRRLNFWILRHVSVQANTFPSAHVAASVAAALVVLTVTPAIGLVFLGVALGIAISCVFGRYHYGLDAIAGVIVAIAAFVVRSGH